MKIAPILLLAYSEEVKLLTFWWHTFPLVLLTEGLSLVLPTSG